jgi:hypothetical protein
MRAYYEGTKELRKELSNLRRLQVHALKLQKVEQRTIDEITEF